MKNESWCFFTVNFLFWTYFDKVGVDYGQLVFAASKVQFRICGFDSTKQVWFADYYQLLSWIFHACQQTHFSYKLPVSIFIIVSFSLSVVFYKLSLLLCISRFARNSYWNRTLIYVKNGIFVYFFSKKIFLKIKTFID